MPSVYRYTASGLDNVELIDLPVYQDDKGEKCITIPNVNELHKAIAKTILTRHGGMSGKELRFLRTMMHLTQAELAKVVSRDAQTIGRWERGPFENDPTAEALIRLMAAERLEIGLSAPVEDVSGWCMQSADVPEIKIDASDPTNYRPLAA
jgi:DNA-binding transcriptional regulator YiaG